MASGNPADSGAHVESSLVTACKGVGLSNQQLQLIIFQLNIRRLEHFYYAKSKDLQAIGLSDDVITRLRAAAAEIQASTNGNGHDGQGQPVFVRKDDSLHVEGFDRKYFIDSTQIHLMDIIGEGTFAVVRRGIWTRSDGKRKSIENLPIEYSFRLDVAVKIMRDLSSVMLEEVQTEASHLLKLQHPNLICMYGIVQNPTMMVFELCEGGSILDRLRDSDKPVPLVSTLLDYCTQIVKALTYLESKRCVHRDVAARNILLSKDEKVCKVCDFGLMRNLKENEQMYIMGPQKKVPFSWCPPESLKQRKFSHASDVWAFGVTMWEIFSLGEEPWIGCRAIDVLKRLDAGERLEKPAHCSQQIYDLCLLCWKLEPNLRPPFTRLKNFLKEAEFNIAEVREIAPSVGDKPLKLSVGERVIVIENTGVMWYGQSERTRQFGTFPRSCVYVHSKSAISAPSPQISSISASPLRPTLPPVGIPPTYMTSQNNSRISLPVKGSGFRNRDRELGHSFMLVMGMLEQDRHGAIQGKSTTSTLRIPCSDNLLHWGPSLFIKPIDYEDPFEAAQKDCFSPSKIELPKFDNASTSNGFAANSNSVDRRNPNLNRMAEAVSSSSSRQSPSSFLSHNQTVPAIPPPPTRTASVAVANQPQQYQMQQQNQQNMPSHSYIPQQPVRLSQLPKDNPLLSEMKGRLAAGGQAPANAAALHGSSSDPFLINRIPQQASSASTSALSTACLVPTPAPALQPVKLPIAQVPSIASSTSSSAAPYRHNPAQQAIVNQIQQKQQAQKQQPAVRTIQPQSQPSIPLPTPIPTPTLTPASASVPVPPSMSSTTTSKSTGPKPQQPNHPAAALIQPQKVALPRPQSATLPPATTSISAVPRPSPSSNSKPTSSFPPPPTVSAIDRKSMIEKEVSSLLPPPSALLLGSNSSTSASASSSNGNSAAPTQPLVQQPAIKTPTITAAQVAEVKHRATPNFQSTAAPPPVALSMSSVLVPTPIHQTGLSAGDAAKRQSNLTDEDITNMIDSTRTAQSQPQMDLSARTTPTQVPIFALANSNRSTCGTTALYGAAWQYGGMGGVPAWSSHTYNPYGGYNMPASYWNGGGITTVAAPSVYPSLTGGMIVNSIPATMPASVPLSSQNPSTSSGITRAEEMEILYKEASFVDRARCDVMMRETKGNTEEALRRLKMEYLQTIGVARDETAARNALTRHEWNLNAAAESLL
ncbi:hypothetical protein WR25_17154 [Diploscapter pachys]|uniref:non-specific protein-tyrosine kinase n=1 Tax=Diploscapter pachys TaxID=2018661 RepID=A0A2A2JH86_9BILA|nr:hypothetical protein WR25_17154 [Diploscapter pachys]